MSVFVLTRLFVLRFEAGDVYPEYSSFRSDPLGTGALYGALQLLPGVSAQRNLEPIWTLGKGQDKTLLFFGATLTKKDPKKDIEALESFAADGGRVVIAFYPLRREAPAWDKKKEKKEKKDKEEKQPGGPTPGKDEGDAAQEQGKKEEDAPWAQMVSTEERWGFRVAFAELPGTTSEAFGKVTVGKQEGPADLPGRLEWHSALYFDTQPKSAAREDAPPPESENAVPPASDNRAATENQGGGSTESREVPAAEEAQLPPKTAWHSLYSWDGHTVVMERPWGKGTLVLCSDSWFVSNEAMSTDRHPELLAWLIGPVSAVVFDETHLGVEGSPGVMTLVRKYRLDGLIASILLLAGLFVWKNSLSLVPKRDVRGTEAGPAAQGRDSHAGLVNLLRRSIPARQIVSVCAEEWQKSFAHDPRATPDIQTRIQTVVQQDSALPLTQRNPVKTYQTICGILAERGRARGHVARRT